MTLFSPKPKSKITKNLQGVQWTPEKRGAVYKHYSKPIQKAFTVPIQVIAPAQIEKSVDLTESAPFTHWMSKREPIEKSYYLEGIASDNKIDWEGDRATNGFLASLNQQINSKSIPLMFGHSNVRLGSLAGSIFSDGQVLLRSRLDDDNPAAQEILRRMTERGESFGYSIGGTGYGRILPDRRRELTQIDLKEVSVVQIPANPRAKITAVVKKDD